MADRTPPQPLNIPNPEQLRIGIVRACFNDEYTSAQLAQATALLDTYGIAYDVIDVPGCFEIAYVLGQQAQSGRYDGLVALGCLIKGETIHFEVVANATAEAIMKMIQEYRIPIGFGIITANTPEQARDRLWLGEDATHAVLQSLVNTNDLRTT